MRLPCSPISSEIVTLPTDIVACSHSRLMIFENFFCFSRTKFPKISLQKRENICKAAKLVFLRKQRIANGPLRRGPRLGFGSVKN